MKKENKVVEKIYCGKCGKTIGRRMSDGSLHIMFGRKRNISDEKKAELIAEGGYVLKRGNRFAMEVFVKGAVQIRCTSPYCDHTTVIFT